MVDNTGNRTWRVLSLIRSARTADVWLMITRSDILAVPRFSAHLDWRALGINILWQCCDQAGSKRKVIELKR